jgi:hypothetical protein
MSTTSDITLTDQEQAQVDLHRKDPRPSYYDAATDSYVPISGDMEIFLILQPQAFLEAGVKWIQQASKLNQSRPDRDALLAEAINQEIIDTQAANTEITTFMKNFDAFRSQFDPDRFAEVDDLSQFMSDLQETLGETAILQSRIQHASKAANYMHIKTYQTNVDAKTVKQVNSWANVLTAYSHT